MTLCQSQLELYYVRSLSRQVPSICERSSQVSLCRAIATGLLTGLEVVRPFDGSSPLIGAHPFNGHTRSSDIR